MGRVNSSPESIRKRWTYWLWPLRWRPLLDFWIDIGLLQVSTALWREAIWNDSRDYLFLEVRLLRKWGFRVRLYDTAMRIANER